MTSSLYFRPVGVLPKEASIKTLLSTATVARFLPMEDHHLSKTETKTSYQRAKSCKQNYAAPHYWPPHMFFSLIYFFAPFSIFYITHNYLILQAVPRAIPQTHSAFYPHREMCSLAESLGQLWLAEWKKLLTALFTNMRTRKFKSRLHNGFFRCRQS